MGVEEEQKSTAMTRLKQETTAAVNDVSRSWLRPVIADAKRHYEIGYDEEKLADAKKEARLRGKEIRGKNEIDILGRIIKRPNHDLTHGARKAALAMDVLDAILRTTAYGRTADEEP